MNDTRSTRPTIRAGRALRGGDCRSRGVSDAGGAPPSRGDLNAASIAQLCDTAGRFLEFRRSFGHSPLSGDVVLEATSMFRRIALLGSLIAAVFAFALPGTAVGASSVEVALVGTFTSPSGIVGGAGGVLAIQGFADDGGLVADGVATYSLCIPGVDPKNCLATLTQAVTIPVSALTATCAQATIDLAALTIVSPPSLDGFTLNFDPIEVTFTADTATTQRTACAIARRLDHGAHDASLARLLNRLLAGL